MFKLNKLNLVAMPNTLLKAVFLLSILGSFECQSQHNLRRTLSNEFSGLGSVWNETNLDEVMKTDGTPNLFSSWPKGTLTFSSGTTLTDVRCNYNAKDNIFMLADVSTQQVYQLSEDEFQRFTYAKSGRDFILEKGNKAEFQKITKDFFVYEIIYLDSTIEVVRVTQKQLRVAGEFARSEYRQDSWLTLETYYFKTGDDVFKKFKVNKRNLTEILPQHVVTGLTQFVNENPEASWSSKQKLMKYLEEHDFN